jgi:hypothetical protein
MFIPTGTSIRFTPSDMECKLRGLLTPAPTMQRSAYLEVDGAKIRLCAAGESQPAEKPSKRKPA